jgi:hypothetical protein
LVSNNKTLTLVKACLTEEPCFPAQNELITLSFEQGQLNTTAKFMTEEAFSSLGRR